MNLKIDGISTSEHIDSSGELLIVENHDISDLVEGKGVLNFEHSNKAEDIVGAVIYARKILKKEDCENDRQRKYWDFCKKPFVYIIGELFEDEEHPGAIAVGAMVRYYNKKSEKMLVGFSIEGATLQRDDYILKESVGRRVAITLRPCNKTAIAGLLEDPKAKSIAKSIAEMSETIDASLVEIDSVILEDEFMPTNPVLDLHKAIEELNKTLEAGMGNMAPGQLTGQAALTREHISGSQKNRLKAAIRDWNRKRPLEEVIKAAMPEVDDEYLHHFTELAHELALKKSQHPHKLIRVSAQHSHNKNQSEEQKKLIEGIYQDPSKAFGGQDFNPGHDDYSSSLTRHKNDAGQDVLIKQPRGKNAENSTHYYELANNFFGMGKHVPVTNHFKSPMLNKNPYVKPGRDEYHQAMEIVKDAKTPLTMDDAKVNKALEKAHSSGELHKLMMMDHILGADWDRHHGNSLIHPKGHLVNIDNDQAFSYGQSIHPWYMNDHRGQPVHPDAAAWVKGLDVKGLVGQMADQGHSSDRIRNATTALKAYQKLADRPGQTLGYMRDTVQGTLTHANLPPVVQPKKAV
jgi:hypothetical protein